MPTRHRQKSRFSFLLLPLLFAAIATYFSWQSTRGAFGEEARRGLIAERSMREALFSELVARRTVLQAKVERLRTDALDADLLDERVRAQLNMAHANEIVIYHRPGTAGGSPDTVSAGLN